MEDEFDFSFNTTDNGDPFRLGPETSNLTHVAPNDERNGQKEDKSLKADKSLRKATEKPSGSFRSESKYPVVERFEPEPEMDLPSPESLGQAGGVTGRDEAVAEVDQESEAAAAPPPAPSTKKKHRSLTLKEDPMQYHAKPSDLARFDDVQGDQASSSSSAKKKRKAQGAGSNGTLVSTIFAKQKFSDIAGLHPRLITVLEKPQGEGGLGLASSTKVQGSILPLLIDGPADTAAAPRSVLVKSQTGSGKTLAFLLPIINDLMHLSPQPKRDGGTRALILSPTRELCTQICQVAESIINKVACHLVTGTVTGGERRKAEKARLRKGVVLLVASPGRLLDHLKSTEAFTLSRLRWVVLDEADRLLDMGFEKAILEILGILRGEANALPSHTQTDSGGLERRYRAKAAAHAKISRDVGGVCYVMASATLSQAVCRLVKPVMGSAVEAAAGKRKKSKSKKRKTSDGGIDNGEEEEDEDDDDDERNDSFYLVDAERGAARLMRPADVDGLLSKQNRDGTVSVPEDWAQPIAGAGAGAQSGTDGGEASGGKGDEEELQESAPVTGAVNGNGKGTSLVAGEVVAAPSTLVQYTMTVSAKWRLAALTSFLKTRCGAKERAKVMVFMATCDSVDFHSMLFRETVWPQEMDPNPRDGSVSSNTGAAERGDNTTAAASGVGASAASGGKKSARKVEAALSAATFSKQSASVKREEQESLEPLEICCRKGILGASVPVYRLHGSVPQTMRQETIRVFSEATEGVLFCTDVAARGLDVPRVDWIVQYDPPCDTSDYIHRAGRTARSGQGGSALLFLLPSEASFATLLHSHGMSTRPMRLDDLFTEVSTEIPGSQTFKNSSEMSAVILQRRYEVTALRNKTLLACGRQAFRSFVRSYATHSSETKSIFKVHSLHLGHVAKTFALSEAPSAQTGGEDIMGKVANGYFSLTRAQERADARRRSRQEKFAVSRSLGGAQRGSKGGKGAKGGGKNDVQINSTHSAWGLSAGGSDKGSRAPQHQRVKLRRMGEPKRTTGGAHGVSLSASGKFRSGGSYFKKKLRSQANSEFASS